MPKTRHGRPAGNAVSTERILFIGERDAHPDPAALLPGAQEVRVAALSEIGADLLGAVRPTIVISPLVDRGWDAVEVADALARAGYEGRYRATADVLPDAGLVRREVRRVARALDFDVLVTGPGRARVH
ncbi:hypothetical protein BCF33_0746 [Hasllibacter halocynthiae]|uniref:Uncharacterized protein n=1 Tax=Hasllibacter halocynthiae TaxID=595589 RepID=A0A2T0X852_9RHOB|nr:hypothetical protein [Hasllibacter halocynthiae]PRY95132.1 hypothetical protein BCF33_0746 [Hasllibacter halocynthiae]